MGVCEKRTKTYQNLSMGAIAYLEEKNGNEKNWSPTGQKRVSEDTFDLSLLDFFCGRLCQSIDFEKGLAL